MKNYSAKSTLSKAKAKLYANELLRIKRVRGKLTPDIVLEEARNKSSVLHRFFEWNERTAASKFRIEQARLLLRIITVQIDGREPVRAFVNIDVENGEGWGQENGQQYFPIQEALDNKGLREILLRDAISEMQFFRRKYERLRELAMVRSAIDKTLKKVAA